MRRPRITSYLTRNTGFLKPLKTSTLAEKRRFAAIILAFENGNLEIYWTKTSFNAAQIHSIKKVIDRLGSLPTTQHVLYVEKANGEATLKPLLTLDINTPTTEFPQPTLEQIANTLGVNRITSIAEDQAVAELFLR